MDRSPETKRSNVREYKVAIVLNSNKAYALYKKKIDLDAESRRSSILLGGDPDTSMISAIDNVS